MSVSLTTMPPSTRSSLFEHRVILHHRVENLARLKGRRFERGARDVALVDVARQSGNDAARVSASRAR